MRWTIESNASSIASASTSLISAYNGFTSPAPTADPSPAYGGGTFNNIATIAAGITIPVINGLILAAFIQENP